MLTSVPESATVPDAQGGKWPPPWAPPKETQVPLDADTAADIARRHGLTLNDAQALTVLADDEEAADRLAAKFAPAPDPDDLAQRVHDHYRATGGAR